MINEDRVRHMTQMAIFARDNEQYYKPMLKYRKKEYVALHGWGGFISGTIIYMAGLAIAVLEFLKNMGDEMDLAKIGFFTAVAGLVYLAYIILHIYFTRFAAKKAYQKGAKLIKERRAQYDKLLSMYEDEAQATRPTKLPASFMKLNDDITD